MKSVRLQLLDRYPPPPRAIEPDDQLGHALYSMLWALKDPDVTVDGWTIFRVKSESELSLDAVGLMTLLPTGSMPIAVHVEASDRGLSWNAQASLNDEVWQSLSESKRWNSVYLLAGGDVAVAPWSWDRAYSGTVS